MYSSCMFRCTVFLQHDDDKDGGTEHGGVPEVAVEVPKLQ
jgi:hypothetical protein